MVTFALPGSPHGPAQKLSHLHPLNRPISESLGLPGERGQTSLSSEDTPTAAWLPLIAAMAGQLRIALLVNIVMRLFT